MKLDTGFTIINLREAGEVRLLFPEEIETVDRANWETMDVAGGIKPLVFANVEPRQTIINEICIDRTRTNQTVLDDVAMLQRWSRPDAKNGAPPPLQIITKDWQIRCVLTEIRVRKQFWTKEGICVRVYLSLTFDELPDVNSNQLRIEPTTQRRSGNSLSGRT